MAYSGRHAWGDNKHCLKRGIRYRATGWMYLGVAVFSYATTALVRTSERWYLMPFRTLTTWIAKLNPWRSSTAQRHRHRRRASSPRPGHFSVNLFFMESTLPGQRYNNIIVHNEKRKLNIHPPPKHRLRSSIRAHYACGRCSTCPLSRSPFLWPAQNRRSPVYSLTERVTLL